jgi:hypothetical protein
MGIFRSLIVSAGSTNVGHDKSGAARRNAARAKQIRHGKLERGFAGSPPSRLAG